ncbi:YcnI family protein [Acidovorax lacteus]|uniref:YcnI family copper-binding membrane protein n=1 Tax=Acidovorax lacteus TaxID=1924988 RepID=UPI0031E871CD
MPSFAIKNVAACALLCSALAGFGTAHAHVVLEYQVAPAASSYKATFKVGHGCSGSPTREVSVDIPAGMRGARPMPKPGWTLRIDRAPLAQPYTSHGREVREDVVRVTWTARTPEDMLAHAHYDEFVLVATTPAQPGMLYWPVRQVCESGRHDWTEVPRAGQKLHDLKSPAAALEVMPAGAAGGHAH